MWTLILAILALGMLIIVHEGGHYFVARWSGMRVARFSLGFGPPLVKWLHKGTQFQIAPVPFGGFVQIVGMNPHEEYDEKDPNVYPNRPAILRFLTIFAGPFTNILFASVLVFVVLVGAGMRLPKVQSVQAGAPAEGKLQTGDVVVAVDGQQIDFLNFLERVRTSEGQPMQLLVRREGKELTVTVAARQFEGGAWRIGVGLGDERQEVSLGAALVGSIRYTVDTSQQVLGGLWDIARGKQKGEVVGPVGITKEIREQVRAGWVAALEFLAFLSVMLGLINLLPVPALDGSRLAFLGYELATRRRPNPKVETAVHMVGTVFLLIVMVLVLFNDIRKVVG